MLNILIIGSKGFIGSHCMQLLAFEHQVWGVDIVNDYISTNYFQVDATNSDFNFIFQRRQFDVCVNCSGAASVQRSFDSPANDFSLNVHNVLKILEAIRVDQPACKFINLSSAAVYGNPSMLPVSEDSELNPLSPYGLHKKFSEEIVQQYAKLFRLKTCSLRLFSMYGPGLTKQLFWDIYTKISCGAHITLWGSGNESRDFMYPNDLVNAIKCVIKSGEFDGDKINVANGIDYSIAEVMETFREQYFMPFTYEFGGQQKIGDPLNWRADISKITSQGYKQTVDLAQGVKKYISWLASVKK